MTEKIRAWMEQRAAALTQARSILDGAYAENRDLNADEQQRYDGVHAEYDARTGKINREQAPADREADAARSANGEQNPVRGQQPGRTGETRADATDGAEYRRSLLRYMAYGVQDAGLRTDALGGSELRDILGVSLGGEGATGGVLAPATMERALLDEIKKQNVIRQLADVRSSGSDVEIPYATAHTKAYLVAEGADFTASTPAFDKKTMKAYKVGALAYITHEAMQDMFLDMEAWIREDFGTAFADLEEEHFLTGTGATMPSGLIPNATLGVTASAAAALTADELLDLMYAVNQKYRSRSAWLMNDSTVLKLRKLKGSDGQYLWQPSIQDGQPDRLLSRPLYTSDTMPEAAAGNAAVLFGDFKRYRILDRKGLYFQRLNEIAATSGQVGFLAYRRYDAALLNTDAVKKLVMKST